MFENSKTFLVPLFLVFVILGCAPKKTSTKTQLEIRQLQTKVFETSNYNSVLKAVINVLQDEDYIIDNVSEGLGFLKAQKEVDIESTWKVVIASAFGGAHARWNKTNIIEVSCNVTQFGNKTKLRANFRFRLMNNRNEIVNSYPIEDENFYRDFFSKVDKSIFLEEKGI